MSKSIEQIDKITHKLYGVVGHGVIGAECGAQMQSGDGTWDSNINHWGRVGIKRHRPWTTITLDDSAVEGDGGKAQ